MKKNSIQATIDFIGLSPKKEILKILLINSFFLIGAVVLYLLFKNYTYSLFAFLGGVIIDFFILNSYSDKKKAILKGRENELISIITYFDVYIRNNSNVYQSFNQLIPYCSNWMKEKIEELLKNIDEDKTAQPFVSFANNFKTLSIHSLMLSIYQMVDQGENSNQLTHFNIIFEEISRNRNKELIEQKEKALSNMSTYPLVGAGIITISLTVSILTILGDLINVI